MTEFEEKYFNKFVFTQVSIKRYQKTAYKDLNIAKDSMVPEVIFQFSYNALIKLGISLIAGNGYKVKSRMGHHIKIIEKTAEILNDNDIATFGNIMRKIRNTELYDGGNTLLTEKQVKSYLNFVNKTFLLTDDYLKDKLGALL